MVQDDLDANQFVDGHQHTKDILIMVVVKVVVVFWNKVYRALDIFQLGRGIHGRDNEQKKPHLHIP